MGHSPYWSPRRRVLKLPSLVRDEVGEHLVQDVLGVPQALQVPVVVLRSSKEEARGCREQLLSNGDATLGHPFAVNGFAVGKLAQHLEADFVEFPQLLVADAVLATVILAVLDIAHEPVVDGVGFAPLGNRDVHGDVWAFIFNDAGRIHCRDDVGVESALVVRAPLTTADELRG